VVSKTFKKVINIVTEKMYSQNVSKMTYR